MATGAMEAGADTATGATGKEAIGLATDIDGAAAAVDGAGAAVAITGAAADVTGLCTEREAPGSPTGDAMQRNVDEKVLFANLIADD